jgi:hypothetical protein
MKTFDLWPLPLGGGAWGAGTNMWHPETPASYESLPAPLATQIPTLWIHKSGGRGRGGALILDRCRAFDLFASVDAHLWFHNPSHHHPYLIPNRVMDEFWCILWHKRTCKMVGSFSSRSYVHDSCRVGEKLTETEELMVEYDGINVPVLSLYIRVRRSSLGVAQLVERWLAVRQTRIRFSSQHLMEASLDERRSDEDTRRRASTNDEGWKNVWLYCMNEC